MGVLTKDDGISQLLDDSDVPLTDEVDDSGTSPLVNGLPFMLLMRLRLHACWLTFLMLSMSHTI